MDRTISANLLRGVFVKLPQNRHPERSEVEGDLRFLFWFSHRLVILSAAPNRFIA
jgi:hypothetical protein